MPVVAVEAGFELDDRVARKLLRDLYVARPALYWLDFVLSSLVGWAAFGLMVGTPLSAGTLLLGAASVFALYRGLSFLHEIAHIRKRSLRAFDAVWNVLIGFPLLLPSFMYTGVHQAHHSLGTYGTSRDPEYLPFAQSRRMTVLFALESILIPAVLLLRYLVLAPVGLIVPRFQRWLASHASALTMNFNYKREVTPRLLTRIRRHSALILVFWGTALAWLPGRFLLMWFAVFSAISFVNTLRTLGAHKYAGSGNPLDRSEQLRDSVDVPGAFWTELWAPVGLRYHALHHYFPGIPYHNLPEAHRRLVSALPANGIYRSASCSGLLASLASLMRRAPSVR